MAHAYTPGLKVTPFTRLVKQRRLPLSGEVLVQRGDRVTPETVIARTSLPGNTMMVNVVRGLNLDPDQVPAALRVQPGTAVKKGDLLAEHRGLFGLMRSQVTSPVEGTVEAISPVTGQVTLREPPIPVEVYGYIDGVVKEVLPGEGALLETAGALIQGIFGIGGETHGPLKVLVDGPDEVLDAPAITPECRGRVLVGGALVTGAALQKALEVGAAGIVAGGIIDQDLVGVLGYDIGVAITGHESLGITLVLTEGFGRIAMARRTFDLLRSLDGRPASLSGATQIRAGVLRPEVIVPLAERPAGGSASEGAGGEMVPGTLVRCIREPYFGQLATVEALPPELQAVETEARVRVLIGRLSDGRRVVLPRANVEMIEG